MQVRKILRVIAQKKQAKEMEKDYVVNKNDSPENGERGVVMKIYVDINAGRDGNGSKEMPYRWIGEAAKAAMPEE